MYYMKNIYRMNKEKGAHMKWFYTNAVLCQNKCKNGITPYKHNFSCHIKLTRMQKSFFSAIQITSAKKWHACAEKWCYSIKSEAQMLFYYVSTSALLCVTLRNLACAMQLNTSEISHRYRPHKDTEVIHISQKQ